MKALPVQFPVPWRRRFAGKLEPAQRRYVHLLDEAGAIVCIAVLDASAETQQFPAMTRDVCITAILITDEDDHEICRWPVGARHLRKGNAPSLSIGDDLLKAFKI